MRFQAVHGRSEAPGGGPQAVWGTTPPGRNSSCVLIAVGCIVFMQVVGGER